MIKSLAEIGNHSILFVKRDPGFALNDREIELVIVSLKVC